VDLQLSFQLVNRRPVPRDFFFPDLVNGYFNDLLKLRDMGFFSTTKDKFLCVDSVTNSRRLDRETTIGIIGAPQKKLSAIRISYTNNYCITVDASTCKGIDGFMFSTDPFWDPKGPSFEASVSLCKRANLDRHQVIFEPHDKKKQYCAEKYTHWKHVVGVLHDKFAGARLVRDGGSAYMKDGRSVFAGVVESEFVMGSAHHGLMSVIDNKLNALAKNWWRAERENCDERWDALVLLRALEWVRPLHIQHMWERNFLLGENKPTLAAVEDMLRHGQKQSVARRELFLTYTVAYEAWMEDMGGQVTPQQYKTLKSCLDGSYWN
jgi:hypothetical protein